MEKRETQIQGNMHGEELGEVDKRQRSGLVSPCKDPFVLVEDYLNSEVEDDIFGELLKSN